MPRTPAAPPADLRQRILETAAALLEEAGPAALSMREVARRAGVTHQAPYHHFPDRESIIAELVTQGFEEMAQRMEKVSRDGTRLSAHDQRVATGLGYVGFALDHPGIFRIMFRPEVCDLRRFPLALQAGRRAYGAMASLVQLGHGSDRVDLFSTAYWAQAHGLACLLVDGPLALALPTRQQRLARARDVLDLIFSGELSSDN